MAAARGGRLPARALRQLLQLSFRQHQQNPQLPYLAEHSTLNSPANLFNSSDAPQNSSSGLFFSPQTAASSSKMALQTSSSAPSLPRLVHGTREVSTSSTVPWLHVSVGSPVRKDGMGLHGTLLADKAFGETGFRGSARFLSTGEESTAAGEVALEEIGGEAGDGYHFNMGNVDTGVLNDLWSSMRLIYRDGKNAARCLQEWEDLPGNALTADLLRALVLKYKKQKQWRPAFELAEFIVRSKDRFDVNVKDYRELIDINCRWERVRRAETMFQNVVPPEHRTEEVYAGILMYFARKGYTIKLEQRLEMMKKMGAEVTARSFNALLMAYAKKRDFSKMEEIFREMKEQGHKTNNQTYNIVIHAFGKAGKWDEMYATFEEMKREIKPDEVTYNSMAWNLLAAKRNEEAERVVEECRAGPGISLSTLVGLMWGYSRQGNTTMVEKAFQEVKDMAFPQTRRVWMARIFAYGVAGEPDRAREVFEEMGAAGLTPVVATYNCLLSTYTRNGKMEKAAEILNRIYSENKHPDAVSLQYMMKGYMDAGDYEKAAEVWTRLVSADKKWQQRPAHAVFIEFLQHFVEKADVKTVGTLVEQGAKFYHLGQDVWASWLKAYLNYREKMDRMEGGESLMTMEEFDEHIEKILQAMRIKKFKPNEQVLELITELGFWKRANDIGLMVKRPHSEVWRSPESAAAGEEGEEGGQEGAESVDGVKSEAGVSGQ